MAGARVVGDNRLPCGHQRVLLMDTDEPQLRRCGICRKKFLCWLVAASEHAREITGGMDLRRIRFEAVV